MVREPHFSDEERRAIRAAVGEVERRTSAEIVAVVVAASARYREVRHLAGLLGLFVSLAAVLLFQDRLAGLRWGGPEAGWLLLVLVLGYVLGAWLGSSSTAIRLLAAPERLTMKVRLRAEQAFYQHGLHRTEGRRAVLIFVSLLERRVVILADRAVDARVAPGTWDGLARELAHSLRTGPPAQALLQAIGRCGAILGERLPSTGERRNELSDDVRGEA